MRQSRTSGSVGGLGEQSPGPTRRAGIPLRRLTLFTSVIALLGLMAVWIFTADRRAAAERSAGSTAPSDSRAEADAGALVHPGSGAQRSEDITPEVPVAGPKLADGAGADEPPEVWEEFDYDAEALLAEIGLPPNAPVAINSHPP